MHPYYCKECGAQAYVIDGAVVRTCDNHAAPVIADRTCQLLGEGHGSAQTASLWQRSVNAVETIIKALNGPQER